MCAITIGAEKARSAGPVPAGLAAAETWMRSLSPDDRLYQGWPDLADGEPRGIQPAGGAPPGIAGRRTAGWAMWPRGRRVPRPNSCSDASGPYPRRTCLPAAGPAASPYIPALPPRPRGAIGRRCYHCSLLSRVPAAMSEGRRRIRLSASSNQTVSLGGALALSRGWRWSRLRVWSPRRSGTPAAVMCTLLMAWSVMVR